MSLCLSAEAMQQYNLIRLTPSGSKPSAETAVHNLTHANPCQSTSQSMCALYRMAVDTCCGGATSSTPEPVGLLGLCCGASCRRQGARQEQAISDLDKALHPQQPHETENRWG